MRWIEISAYTGSLLAYHPGGRDPGSLQPALVEAVKAYATIGEICGTLRSVWGVHTPDTAV